MFCSIVIPTIGRSSLNRSVLSVLNQKFSNAVFEIIIVNDSAEPLQAAEWQHDKRVSIINTQKRERNFARNSGAAIARGRYLLFLDDDDLLLPDALNSFYDLSKTHPEAVWLYGGIRILDANEKIISEVNSRLSGNCAAQIMGGAWAPIQSSMVDAKTFFEIGGYNPLIIGTEDLDLCRRFAMVGEFANTSQTVACLQRGAAWETTTNYQRGPEDTRYSRDLILAQPGALSRMLTSSSNAYWRGRILRICLSTISYNVRKRAYFIAVNRLILGLSSMLHSSRSVFFNDYWAGVKADHVPDTLHFIMKQYEEN
jgi:glycosyltransferase involved in cell wall biosynthesis